MRPAKGLLNTSALLIPVLLNLTFARVTCVPLLTGLPQRCPCPLVPRSLPIRSVIECTPDARKSVGACVVHEKIFMTPFTSNER